MDCVIDCEFLIGAQGEEIPKEISVAGENVRDISFQKPVPNVAPQLRGERYFLGLWKSGICKVI
jgi:hypothetical protein